MVEGFDYGVAEAERTETQTALSEAQQTSERIVAEAQEQAKQTLDDARKAAQQEAFDLRRQALKEVKAILSRVESVRAAADEELETQRIFSNIAKIKANSATLITGQTANGHVEVTGGLPVDVSPTPIAEAISETSALVTAEVSDQPKAATGRKATGKRDKKAAK